MGKRKNKHRNHQSGRESQIVGNPGQPAVLPTQEFLAKHEIERVKLDKDSYANKVRSERPIDKSHKLYCIDRDRGIGENYRRGINDDQFRAADRLANNHKRRFPQMTVPMDAIRVDSTMNISMYPVESIMDAVNQHARLMRQLSLLSQDIVEQICCNEMSLMSYEHGKRWRKGYAITRLREALDELIAAYGSMKKVRKRSR